MKKALTAAPKSPRARIEIPTDVTFESIDGEKFMTVREAARLGNIHPVVVEMGQELLKKVGTGGAAFSLGTTAMQSKAAEIEKMFRIGLKRVAKALDPNRKLKVKSHADTNRLVFWFTG